jgi:hypothetical protein
MKIGIFLFNNFQWFVNHYSYTFPIYILELISYVSQNYSVMYCSLPLWRVHEIKTHVSCISHTWFIYNLNTILY